MNEKTKKIVQWVLGGLVTLLFVFSAFGKLTANDEMIKQVSAMGLDASSLKALGVIEIIAAILFIIPRTGVLGTLLLVAYMGGAICAHLTHGLPLETVCGISAFVWIVAVFRFPELTSRIMGK